MREMYFEVPSITDEVTMSVVNEEEVYSFKVVFFESTYSNLRTVTVCSDHKEDGSVDVQTLSALTEGHRENEFEFMYEIGNDLKITISAFMALDYRVIHVKY